MKFLVILILILPIMFVSVNAEPYLLDPNFVVDKYVSGFEFVTNMAFIGNDILVLEKAGNVKLVKNGILKEDSIHSFNVNYLGEAGLLGITTDGTTVYLYLTESETMLGPSIVNRIYKFDWDGEKLQNQKLVNELPVHAERLQHNGGVMVTSADGKVFAVIGDTHREGLLQNFETGELDDSGIIFHVGLEESIIKPSESDDPISHYYGMGIRNSFGLAFDPITGNLWDTENGYTDFDEVNFVPPNYNSGWKKIMGPSTQKQRESLPGFYEFQYSDPEFSWEHTVVPTALTFVNSDLFEHYKDSLFSADFRTGTIYKFKLNSERTGFVFDDDKLSDLVLNTQDSPKEIIFASGFRGITDLEFGPDGLLYVLSGRAIYKISPDAESKEVFQASFPNWLKNNGKWWNEGKIEDSEFVNAIEFVIHQKIVDLHVKPHSLFESPVDIPVNIKTDAGKWASGELSDEDFFSTLKILIDKNIIKIKKQSCNDAPDFGVNLSGCDLSGIDLSGKDLKAAKLRNVNLKNSDLSNTDLRLAQMQMGIFTDSKIVNSDLQFADLNQANLENAMITDSNLHFVNLEGANLNGTDLSNSNLSKSNLINAFISNAKLTKSDLSFSHLDNAILTNSDLTYTNFFYADLSGTDLTNADLTNANLTGANLTDAKIENANFTGAEMNDCDGCP